MILFQSHTKQMIDNSVASSPHGILFSGPDGAGKAYAAKYFASLKLDLKSIVDLENYPYYRNIQPVKNTISIDQIRELQKFLQLKTPGDGGIRRVALVEDAQYMTTEAQNALLKSLEEPPTDTVIILTAPATLKLKETIYSRVQQIAVLPVSKQQAEQYFATYPSGEIDKAYAMSGGHAGLLFALVNDQQHHLAQEITRAKKIISSSRFDRLVSVDEISKQKDLLPQFLQASKIICTAALHNSVQKQDTKQSKRWHSALDAIYRAEAVLPSNPNTKLLLTDLMLQL